MTLLRAAATVGSLTFLSRLVGFARDMLVAAVLGAGPLADAFVIAFKLPNFLRRLFGEGAFTVGFVPLFARTLEGEGREEARAFAGEAQAVLTAILLVVCAAAIAFMPAFLAVVAPGLDRGSTTYETAVTLSRITFGYILFISLCALLGGVLNSIGRFAAPAAAPVALNIVLICALLFGTPYVPTPAHALAWGVLIAGVVQYLWLVFSCARAGMLPPLRRPRITPRVKRLYQLVLPGVFGASVAQVNLLFDVFFASFLPAGAFAYLYYADRVNQLPLGVVAAALGTALLPLLSRQLRAGNDAAAMHNQNRAIELALLLTLPAVAALTAIGRPIIAVLFERGAFDAADTTATVAALRAYAFGLPAFCLIKVLAPGFFARQDTRTPVWIAVVSLIANIGLTATLIGPLAHVGIALASALSNWLNAALLGVLLHRRGHLRLDARLSARLPRIALAALLMGLGLWGLDLVMAAVPKPAALAVLIAAGLAGFGLLAQATGGADLREVAGTLRRRA